MADDACEGLLNLSISKDDSESEEKYSKLVLRAKELVGEGNVREALKLNRAALKLCYSEKLERKIQRMQIYLKENDSQMTEERGKEPGSRKCSPDAISSPTADALSRLSEEDQVQYAMLISEAKQMVTEKRVPEALALNKRALSILHSEKLLRKIRNMEMYLKQNGVTESPKVQSRKDENRLDVELNGNNKMDTLEKAKTSSSENGGQILGSQGSSVTGGDNSQFTTLVTEAKVMTSDGNIQGALKLYKQAAQIKPSEKLSRKIQKIEMFLQQNGATGSKSESLKREAVKMQGDIKNQAKSVVQPNYHHPTTDNKCADSLSEEDQIQFATLVSKAKDLTSHGQIVEGLTLYRQAVKIYPSEKLTRKIQKIELYLKENSMVSSGSGKSHQEKEDNKEKLGTEHMETESTSCQDTKPPTTFIDAGSHDMERQTSVTHFRTNGIQEQHTSFTDIGSHNTPQRTSVTGTESRNTPQRPSVTDIGSLTEEDQIQFATFVSEAKDLTSRGEIQAALSSYKKAVQIYSSSKLMNKIKKLQDYIKESGQSGSKEESQARHVSMDRTPEKQANQNKTPERHRSHSSLSVEQQKTYNDLVMKAKKLATDGDIEEALKYNKKALEICFSEKLQKRIQKMEAYLNENDREEESEEGMVHIGNGFHLYKDLAKNLYAHQKQGVMWMWGLHQKRKGGILGDDMGLGKTIQVIAFLSGLFDLDKVHSVLIVMPVSVIGNWEKEFSKWAPGIRIESYHGSKREKERSLSKVQRRGGVLLTSYGLVVTSWEMLSKQEGRSFRWDYLILDEGHKIKNPTKTTKGVHQIAGTHRILLTGTPIQNNLREMWSLFDFVHQGTLLGTARTFKMEYENPITRARERDATANERRLGMEMAESLKQIISPYFLRRTKAEVDKGEKSMESTSKETVKMPSMMRKNDFIVWLFLTSAQQRIYGDFLSLDSVKELLMTKKSPLVALTVLKKICDHPRLLSRRACAQLGLDGEDRLDDSSLESEEGHQCAANQIQDMPDDLLINESGKLIVIIDLLDQMKREGHRCLVFSQSRKMLDIIQQLIKNRGHKVMRLDGTVTQLSERDKRIATFQEDMTFSVFLLTTQVGGVGLTLTAADRVIIYDPSWNPATDAQAVDRVFRIGQDKNVVIYRLITCGTVEEKIYRRQIFKDSITRQTTGNAKNPYRYFTKQELKELFTLDNPRESKTQQQLEEMHSKQRNTDSTLDSHIAFLYSLDCSKNEMDIFGISDHDLMFTQEKCDFEDDGVGEAEVESGTDYIQHRVQKAQELLKMESDLSQDFDQRVGKHQRNVDSGPDGSQKPYSRPWGDWDMQGNVHSEKNSKQESVSSEEENNEEMETDEIEIKTEVEENNSPIDLTTPVTSPAKDAGYVDLTTPDVKKEVKTENLSVDADHDSENSDAECSDREIVEEVTPQDLTQDGNTVPKIENLSIKEESVSDNEDLGVQDSLSPSKEKLDNGHCVGLESEKGDSFQDTPKKDDSVLESSDEENKENIPLSQIISNAKKSLDPIVLNRSLSSQPRSPLTALNMSSSDSPLKKKPRKSVSHSPWLKRTPTAQERKSVVEEEIFISPDQSRPLLGIQSKKPSSKVVSNLNATMLSMFSESPDISPRLSKTDFIIPLDSGGSSDSRLYSTFVEESPDKLEASKGMDSTFVPNSLQNTPAVNERRDSLGHNAVVETDEDCTPVKGSQDMIVDSADEANIDESHSPSRLGRVTVEDSCSDEELPIKSDKKKGGIRAVIESDGESENSDHSDSEQNKSKHVIKKKRKSSDLNDSRRTRTKYAELSSSDDDSIGSESKNKIGAIDGDELEVESSVEEECSVSDDVQEVESSAEEEDSVQDNVQEVESSGEDEEDSEQSVGSDEAVSGSEDEDFDTLSQDLKDKYHHSVNAGRDLYKTKKYEESLEKILQALEIFPDPALQALALKIHQKIN